MTNIQNTISEIVKELYGYEIAPESVALTPTRKDFEGDYTLVVFPFTKAAKKKPEEIGAEIGAALQERVHEINSYNVVKGFLNIAFSQTHWRSFLLEHAVQEDFGTQPAKGEKIMVEFSSPNTNKPLHLGHIRTILLGWSVSQILEMTGYEVIKTQIVNDRGIAICRSMLSWQKFADGATPQSTGTKGDHFVGKYYVAFSKRFEEEYADWQNTDAAKQEYANRKNKEQSEKEFFKAYKNNYFNTYSLLGKEARELLLKWEANDPDVRTLWQMMNSWVYAGFDDTYQKLGVSFDKLYYESDTYLLGKELIEKGLQDGVLEKDGQRVWIDLEDVKLNKKTIIKSDGTSTYTSQDIGTANIRYQEYGAKKMVYVVGDEQDNHFQVLFEIIKRLGEPYADGLYHLSYGMIDLPTGKMKSREGTVVDADDLIQEVIEEARKGTAERGDADDEETIRQIGLAALKYFILKVNPKKRMVFNPAESVDLQGQTGPYIQYSYVRINGVLKRAQQENISTSTADQYNDLQEQELHLIQHLHRFPDIVQEAADKLDPSEIAQYCYTLAKLYHKFWHDLSILNADDKNAIAFRLTLSKAVGQILQRGMLLLGIEMPEKM